MSESYFAKIVNEVLDASEKLTIRIEEGLQVVMSGGQDAVPKTGTIPPTTEHEFEGWDEEDYETDYAADDESSPLAGIAESVMGDILSSQVRVLRGTGVDIRASSAETLVQTDGPVERTRSNICISVNRKVPNRRGSTWMPFDTPLRGRSPLSFALSSFKSSFLDSPFSWDAETAAWCPVSR